IEHVFCCPEIRHHIEAVLVFFIQLERVQIGDGCRVVHINRVIIPPHHRKKLSTKALPRMSTMRSLGEISACLLVPRRQGAFSETIDNELAVILRASAEEML